MLLTFLLLPALIAAGHIAAGPSAVRYASSGTPIYYSLRLALENPLPADAFFKIVLPAAIHSGTDKTSVTLTLKNAINELILAQFKCSPVADTNPQYWASPGTAL